MGYMTGNSVFKFLQKIFEKREKTPLNASEDGVILSKGQALRKENLQKIC